MKQDQLTSSIKSGSLTVTVTVTEVAHQNAEEKAEPRKEQKFEREAQQTSVSKWLMSSEKIQK
jgi:hypothetical protein